METEKRRIESMKNREMEKTESRTHRAKIWREGERGRRQILDRDGNQEREGG